MSFLKNLFGKRADGDVTLHKPAPEFSLPDENGNTVSLSDYTGKRNVLVIFIRGDFCPFCQMMLRTFQKERERFVQKNVLMISVCPGPAVFSHEVVKKMELDYKLLCDHKQMVMQKYRCHDAEDKRAYPEGMPIPGTFLINKNGFLHYYSRADKAEEAFNPSAIFTALESLN